MGGSAGTKKGAMAEMNVTPLIDVVLVLLVVFMVVTPMLQSGQPVEMPMATQALSEQDVGQYVVVSVTTDKGWWVEGEQVCGKDAASACTAEAHGEVLTDLVKDEIKKKLEAPKAPDAAPQGTFILIKADAKLAYEQVRVVMDAIASEGMTTQMLAADKGS